MFGFDSALSLIESNKGNGVPSDRMELTVVDRHVSVYKVEQALPLEVCE